ncbi:MAG: anaerobic ribonucleoside-triphosphate reductase activating protein [Holosporales bacterium]|nr:anaerobic ribonucleoside-triphosphate reductase activating protein [Holosporales bacterium]
MKIGGLLKFSALDYPGKLSCVVFCQGCPLKCIYCHNPDFLDSSKNGDVSFDEFLSFICERKGCLDAIVFSGGEPLLQLDLPESILIAKEHGFLIGIHTSGIIPELFERIIPLVDWIGFDVKTVFPKYHTITSISNSGRAVEKSLSLLLNSATPHEIRTTYDSRFISSADLIEIAQTLRNAGVKKWVIQECSIRENNGNTKLPLPDHTIINKLSNIIQVGLRQQ